MNYDMGKRPTVIRTAGAAGQGEALTRFHLFLRRGLRAAGSFSQHDLRPQEELESKLYGYYAMD